MIDFCTSPTGSTVIFSSTILRTLQSQVWVGGWVREGGGVYVEKDSGEKWQSTVSDVQVNTLHVAYCVLYNGSTLVHYIEKCTD